MEKLLKICFYFPIIMLLSLQETVYKFILSSEVFNFAQLIKNILCIDIYKLCSERNQTLKEKKN